MIGYLFLDNDEVKIQYNKDNKDYGPYGDFHGTLLPFIYGGNTNFANIPNKNFLEMGLYDKDTHKKYYTPFVWKHVKILTIELDYSKGPFSRIFTAEVLITIDFKSVIKHTFLVKNGPHFFVNSILRTINYLIDKGYLIEEIDFDFLDDQCVCYHSDYANEKELLSRSGGYDYTLDPANYLENFYSLITNLNIVVYLDTWDPYSHTGQYVWQEIDLIINTNDRYIISIIDEILNHHRDYSVRTEKKTTIFTFKSKEYWSSTWIKNKVLANEKMHNQVKELYIRKLLLLGIQMIPKRNIIEFFSTKKMKKS